MKKRLKVQGILMLIFCFGFLLAGTIKAEAAQTVVKGSYTYFAEDGTIYKMNSKSGKISKLTKIKRSNTVEVVGVKGSWLYLTVDDYFSIKGTDNSWSYVYRIKTNGKSLQSLGQGKNPVLYGNYIYYEGLTFSRKIGSQSSYARTKGLYRMKLNGSSKRRLCVQNSCTWLKIYNKRIYFRTDRSNRWGIYSVNLSGKDLKAHVYDCTTPNAPYFAKNKMYFTHTTYNANTIYVCDLSKGTLSKLRAGYMLTAYNGEIYYYTGTYPSYTLYRYKVSTRQNKRICKRNIFNNVIGGKKWIIINYGRVNKKHNIGVDRIKLNGTSRKVITTYFRS